VGIDIHLAAQALTGTEVAYVQAAVVVGTDVVRIVQRVVRIGHLVAVALECSCNQLVAGAGAATLLSLL
jgi:hypothetical protein